MNPPRHLPGDGFPWFLFLILGLHVAAAGGLLRLADRPASVPLSTEPAAADAASAFVPSEVRWVTASLSLPPPPPPPPAPAPEQPLPNPDEPESDLPLPTPPAPTPEPPPKPEPKPEPVLRPLPELRPAPAPLPPPPPTPTPTPAPKAVTPPKLVATVPPSPAPKAAPILKPAPVPVPAAPTPAPPVVVAKAVPISRPVAPPVAVPVASASGGTSAGGPDGVAAFHQEVRETYMSRWQQPRDLLTTGAKFRVRAEIIIDPTGTVVSARIVSPSGNAEVDQSVRDTVRQVSRVPPLPPGLASPTYSVILNFDL